jgi:hypothetical protein
LVSGDFELGNTCNTIFPMATVKRTRFQIDASPTLIDQAKEVAIRRRLTLTDFVLLALAKEGNKELTKLIEKELAEKQRPGRPQQ